MIPFLRGFFLAASQSAAPVVSPPSIADSIQSGYANAAANDHVLATGALSWSAGQEVITFHGSTGSVDVDTVSGDTNDTFAQLQQTVTTEAQLWLHLGTINGGALDANITFSFSTAATRRACSFALALNGCSGADVNASNHAVASGAGGTVTSAAFTVDAPNCLIITALNVRGGHVSSPPTAPAGYTLLGSVQHNSANSPTGTSVNTLAVAWKTQAAAGAVATATWGGMTSLGTSNWSSIHTAWKP